MLEGGDGVGSRRAGRSTSWALALRPGGEREEGRKKGMRRGEREREGGGGGGEEKRGWRKKRR